MYISVQSHAKNGTCLMLGFMHQPDEPKSLSSWEEVGNPLILHNTPTHICALFRLHVSESVVKY